MGGDAVIGVVMPAYNEEQMVGSLVTSLLQIGLPVIVVDDASSDATAASAEAAGAKVISMPLRAGAWGATQTGIRHALRLGWERIITMDADGQHLPSSLPAMLKKADQADVVIGACPCRASRLRHIAWGVFRTLSGLNIRDLTSGLRVYSRDAARLALNATATMADYQDVAILLLLQGRGLCLLEIPVPMRARADGKSRIFCSWGKVFVYMMCTILLSSARHGTPFFSSAPHSGRKASETGFGGRQ